MPSGAEAQIGWVPQVSFLRPGKPHIYAVVLAGRMGILEHNLDRQPVGHAFESTSSSPAWLVSDDLTNATDSFIFPLMQ